MKDIIKFTNEDRSLVVAELEKIQKSKLEPVKPSRKLFKDEKGMFYLIFGGKNDWHGIRPNLIEQIAQNNKEGALVIAKKYRTKMDICVGSLLKLMLNKTKLVKTAKGDYQFHVFLTEDGLFLKEIPELYLNKVSEIFYPSHKPNFQNLREISKIINIEIPNEAELTHSDIQAKLILIGSYLNYRTFTPDKSKESIYGMLGNLCSEQSIPDDYIPAKQLDTVKFIDVIWFDSEGCPTHCFEVEHSTDVTKGLLRLYQVRKFRIKMFIVADESKRDKFKKEILKSPFSKIKEEYVFRNYADLDEFFESVKQFTKVQGKFLNG